MKNNKIIIIIMVTIILINSIILPNNAHAVAETAIAVAGTKAAAEILVAFVAIMASQGIIFATWNDANEMYKAFNEDTIPEISELTPPWRISLGDIEYYMQNGYWEGDGPPPENPPPENNIFSSIILGILAGGLAISDFLDIGNKTKEIIDILGNDEGENLIENDINIINGYSYQLSVDKTNGTHVLLSINGGQNHVLLTTAGVITYEVEITNIREFGKLRVDYKWKFKDDTIIRDGEILIPYDEIGANPISGDNITYYITNNSPIITDTPLKTIPLPQIEKLPKEKIEIVIMPDGTKKVIYDGNIDEIVGIITDTYPIEDMYPKPGTPPYELVETDEKTEIKPIIPPTPWPNPDIQPNPDLPENEQDVIPWIQVVINWISETNNTIKDIIIPPEEYEPPELDFEPLKNIVILDKFPFSLPWDMKYVISQFISNDTQAPLFEVDFPISVSAVNWTQDVKFDIDFEPFTPLANIMRIMLSLIFVIGLIILTRTFIGGA